jgi:hypothetical protein
MSLLIAIKREVALRPSMADDGLVDPRNLLPPENDDIVPRIITRPQIMDVSWPQVLMVYPAPRNFLPPGNDYTVLRIIIGSQIMDVSIATFLLHSRMWRQDLRLLSL